MPDERISTRRVEVPAAWLARTINLLNEMACEGISMDDCADPADLMCEMAEHMGLVASDDPWAAVAVALNGEAADGQ